MMDSYITSRGTTDSNFTWDIGSNYIAKKYDNGVMELNGKYTGIMNVNLTWMTGVYYQDLVNMNFPVQFTSSPYLVPVLCRESSDAALNLIPKNINATGFTYYIISMQSPITNAPYSISYTAVGYWK